MFPLNTLFFLYLRHDPLCRVLPDNLILDRHLKYRMKDNMDIFNGTDFELLFLDQIK